MNKMKGLVALIIALFLAIVLPCRMIHAITFWPDQFEEFDFELLSRAVLNADDTFTYEYVFYRIDGGDISYRGLSHFLLIGCPHPDDPPGTEDVIAFSSDESWTPEYGYFNEPLFDENGNVYGFKLESNELDGMIPDGDSISFVSAGTFDWVDYASLPTSADDSDDSYLLFTITSIHSPVLTDWYAKDGSYPGEESEFYYDTGETIYPCGPPIPEPATILLLGSSLMGFPIFSGKRKSRK